MLRRRSLFTSWHPVRAFLIVLGSIGLLFVWNWYRTAYEFHKGFGRDVGVVLPIYADERPYALSELHGTTTRLCLAIGISITCVGLLWTAVARRWPTVVCLALALASTLAINVSVARIAQGNKSFTWPFSRQGLEYFFDKRLVRDDPRAFIEKYPKLNNNSGFGLSHHAGTHPPGGVLFLWLGDKLFALPPAPVLPKPNALQRFFGAQDPDEIDTVRGLNESCWWAVSFTALGVIPAYVLARSIGGAAAARRLLPLYVATPNLILFGATCMDGVFLTFTLSAMAAGFIAMRRWSVIRPIAAGVLLWAASFMTFSAIAVPILMGSFTLCYGLFRPREGLRMLARAGIVGIVFLVTQALSARFLRYDVVATLDAAMRRDFEGMRTTGYESFWVWRNISLGNLLAFSVGSGVALTALFFTALAAWRVPRRSWAFSIALPLCVVALACSTLFSMETERVWLFLTPAALIVTTRAFRGVVVWILVLALSLAQAIALEWCFNTWW